MNFNTEISQYFRSQLYGFPLYNGTFVSKVVYLYKNSPQVLEVAFNECLNSSLPRHNGRHFADDIFKWIFMYEKFYILFKFHRSLFLRAIWQYGSTGSGNGLTPNRQQGITCTNADPILWRIYAALVETSLVDIFNGTFTIIIHICVNKFVNC